MASSNSKCNGRHLIMNWQWQKYIRSAEDDWTHIADKAARKRIQNRLAQRAHRSRNGSPLHLRTASASGSNITKEALECHHIQRRLAQSIPSKSLHCEGRSLTLPGMLTLAAFMTNRQILAILECGQPIPSIHINPSIPTPPALTPTTLQTNKLHLPYIDLIPFPQFRDNLLRAGEIVQSEDLWHDMISGKLKVWGKTPWDRRGWEMHEDFVAKWWWLIAEDILEETNFWRVSRGEDPLLPTLRPVA
ncbi:hypothetical protein J3E69DRAFT_348596 [Trichoderma sp. SZMC 28015]